MVEAMAAVDAVVEAEEEGEEEGVVEEVPRGARLPLAAGVVDEVGVGVEVLLYLVTMSQMAMVSDLFYEQSALPDDLHT